MKVLDTRDERHAAPLVKLKLTIVRCKLFRIIKIRKDQNCLQATRVKTSKLVYGRRLFLVFIYFLQIICSTIFPHHG